MSFLTSVTDVNVTILTSVFEVSMLTSIFKKLMLTISILTSKIDVNDLHVDIHFYFLKNQC